MKYKEKDGGFPSLGEFLVKVRMACDRPNNADSRLLNAPIGKTAGHMESGEDSQGGFLIPEQYAGEIMQAVLEGAIVRPRAKVINATSDSLKIRRLVETDRSSNYFGGITFKWLAEAEQKSSTGKPTKPALGQLELTPHKIIGSCWVSNELEDDYPAFGDFFKLSFGQAISFEEDYRFIWGTGAGQPLGAANAGNGSRIAVPRNAANEVEYDDIMDMAERLLPGCWESKSTVWLINPDTIDQIAELEAGEANVTNIVDLNERKILGFPVIVTEKASPLGDTGDIILADFSHYAIADREMVIAASRHVERSGIMATSIGFSTDETFWKVQLRIDGQPTLTDDITPYQGANTLSPFVVLTDAAE